MGIRAIISSHLISSHLISSQLIEAMARPPHPSHAASSAAERPAAAAAAGGSGGAAGGGTPPCTIAGLCRRLSPHLAPDWVWWLVRNPPLLAAVARSLYDTDEPSLLRLLDDAHPIPSHPRYPYMHLIPSYPIPGTRTCT